MSKDLASVQMTFFNSKLAREVVRSTGWRDKVWARRYQAIVVSNEEAAQVDRLRYVLAHGCKENLVARLEEWPGVHSATALVSGKPMKGVWYDRTREYLARMKGEDANLESFAESETLTLASLPCWAHLPPEEYQARIAALVQEIEADADVARRRTGCEPLGPDAIRRQDPTAQPNRIKKSPAPRFHAFRKQVRKELCRAYSWFVAAFREAAERLRAGDRTAQFPIGSFPPHLPFIRQVPPIPSAAG